MRITKEALLSTLPVVLAEDDGMRALAEPIAEELAERLPEIDLVRLYTRIDELPEELLDILAYDFKADWWEYDATLEEKRSVFKKIWFVHRHKGTKASVEEAVGALFPGAEVEEWFEYDGEPYHFRMNVPIKEVQVRNSATDYKDRVFFLVNYFKNLRSVLETIFFTFETELDTELHTLSHLGRGLVITPIPEWFPDWNKDISLYVTGMMPRWYKTVIKTDLTENTLVIRAVPEQYMIEIWGYLGMIGGHDMSAQGSEEGNVITIQNAGISVVEDSRTKTLIITGG